MAKFVQTTFFLMFLKTETPKEILRRVLRVYETLMTVNGYALHCCKQKSEAEMQRWLLMKSKYRTQNLNGLIS